MGGLAPHLQRGFDHVLGDQLAILRFATGVAIVVIGTENINLGELLCASHEVRIIFCVFDCADGMRS